MDGAIYGKNGLGYRKIFKRKGILGSNLSTHLGKKEEFLNGVWLGWFKMGKNFKQ